MKVNKSLLIESIFEYLYIIFVILEFNTVYTGSKQFSHIAEIAIAISAFLFLVKCGSHKIVKKRFSHYIIFLTIYFLLMIVFTIKSVDSTKLMGFSMRFLIFLPLSIAIFYLFSDDNIIRGSMIKKYVNVVVILAFSSLLFWLFGSCLNIIEPNMSINSFWAYNIDYRGYCGLLFENPSQMSNLFGLNTYRNDGIFSEGPMYSACLGFALAFELFNLNPNIKEKHSRHKLKLIILTMTLLSTLTFSSILVALALYIFFYYNMFSRGKAKIILRVLFIFVTILIVFSPVFSLYLDKINSYSGITRINSHLSALMTWREYPIFGSGYDSMTLINQKSMFLYGRLSGESNSISIILGEGGIVLALVYVLPIIALLKTGIKEHNYILISNFIIIVFEMIVTYFQYKLILLFFISYLYYFLLTNKHEK